MKGRNFKTSITLQAPADFRTSHADGVMMLSDGTPLKPVSRGFYCLDHAHTHLLRRLVAQGWHAPRPELSTPNYAREVGSAAHGDMLNTAAILTLAGAEQVELKFNDGRILMRGEPSARLRAHLRGARTALRDELERRTQKPWVEI